MHIFSTDTAAQLAPAIYATPIQGLLFIHSEQHTDHRGFYAELAKIPDFQDFCEKPFIPIQINHSHSKQYVIRGFHAEDWNKLVTVIRGECFCVFADFRQDSPSFGQSVALTLGTESSALYGSVYIPNGIGNSSLALSSDIDYLYMVDKLYADRDPNGDISVSLFDPDLAIPWPVAHNQLIYSQRDTQAVTLREKYPHKFLAT